MICRSVTFIFVGKILWCYIIQIKPSWQDVSMVLFIFLEFNWIKFYVGRTKSERLNWSLFEKRAKVQNTRRLFVIYAHIERNLRWTITMSVRANKSLCPIFAFAGGWGGRRRSCLLGRTSGVRSSTSGVRGSTSGIWCATVGVKCCHLCCCCLLSGESGC